MTRRSRFRRRRFAFASLLRLVLLLVACWLAGFVVFMGTVWSARAPRPMPAADGIVALTGGDDRVAEALALLGEKAAPRLLISGAGRGTYLGDFTADNPHAATAYASRITLGHQATTTLGNAVETAQWVRAHGMRSLIIVTAAYHMPRALLEIHRMLPGIRLVAVPVQPPAMGHVLTGSTWRLLAVEYCKYLVVRARFEDYLSGF